MNNNRSRLLVFDCDPGCDDAIALAYILDNGSYNRIDILTVAGNVSVDQTTANAARVVAAWKYGKAFCNTKSKIPECYIYPGCSRSLTGDLPLAASVHGRDGLGDVPNMEWRLPEPEKKSAVERLLELSRGRGEKFDLLCTGPLTNIACALISMNEAEIKAFWSRCQVVVIMGGVFTSQGNITHSAEFNIFADPVAAHLVLSLAESSMERAPYFVPLDVTEQMAIPLYSWNEIDKDKADEKMLTRFLRYVLKQYGEFHVFSAAKRPKNIEGYDEKEYVEAQLRGKSGLGHIKPFCYLHDPLAAWILVNRQFSTDIWESNNIRIDTSRGENRGRVMICDTHKERAPVSVPTLGTNVNWMSPDKNDNKGDEFEKMRESFLDSMKDLLGVKTLQKAKNRSQ